MAKQSGQAQQPIGNRIPSGFDGINIPTDFSIPACGIEDVDTAIFNLFNRDNFLQVTVNDEEGNFSYKHKVPIVFSTGERFVLRQRQMPIRDKTGAIRTPIISISRKSISQEMSFMGGMGIAQNTGDLVIKKKLSSGDRIWQKLINKQSIENQDNVASTSNFLNEALETGNDPGTLASRREKFTKKSDQMLESDLKSNIYEIITMPFPRFYHATYEIVIWTSFRQHMNEIVEKIMTNYDGQAHAYRINTEKGYWFVAYFEDDIGSEDNNEDFTDELRIHKTIFTVNVPAYMIANRNGGDMVPFRRYYSAPQLSFSFIDGIFDQPFVSDAPSGDINKFILNDVEDLKENGEVDYGREPQYFQKRIIKDPFGNGEKEIFYRIKYRNARSGETVISAKEIYNIDIP